MHKGGELVLIEENREQSSSKSSSAAEKAEEVQNIARSIADGESSEDAAYED